MADAWSYLPGTSGDAWTRMHGTTGDAWSRLPGTVGDAWTRLIASIGPIIPIDTVWEAVVPLVLPRIVSVGSLVRFIGDGLRLVRAQTVASWTWAAKPIQLTRFRKPKSLSHDIAGTEITRQITAKKE